MTLDDVLASLFPTGHSVGVEGALIGGDASINGAGVHVIGITGESPLGVDDALTLAGRVLGIVRQGGSAPILVLIDSSSQQMSKRDELLGISEYLAHLAKTLLLAKLQGHRTIGLLYGGSAAGAFIATALATDTLVGLPGAHPAVMDLPSMARVTKLPIEVLKAKAETTPVFAPGLDNLAKTGAVHEVWNPDRSLAEQFLEVLDKPAGGDLRDQLGKKRGGRPKAAAIAARIQSEAFHG